MSEPTPGSYCSSGHHRAPLVVEHLAGLSSGSPEPARPRAQRAVIPVRVVDPGLDQTSGLTRLVLRSDSSVRAQLRLLFQTEAGGRSPRDTESELLTFLQFLNLEHTMELRRVLIDMSGGYNGLLHLVDDTEAVERICADTEALADSYRNKVTDMVQALRDALMASARRNASVTVTGPERAIADAREDVGWIVPAMTFAERLACLMHRLVRLGAAVASRSPSQEQAQELYIILLRTSGGNATLLALDMQVLTMHLMAGEIEALAASTSSSVPTTTQELRRTYMSSPQGRKLRRELMSLTYGLHRADEEVLVETAPIGTSVTATGPECVTANPLGRHEFSEPQFTISPGNGGCSNPLISTPLRPGMVAPLDVTHSVENARLQSQQPRAHAFTQTRAVQRSDGNLVYLHSPVSGRIASMRVDTEGAKF